MFRLCRSTILLLRSMTCFCSWSLLSFDLSDSSHKRVWVLLKSPMVFLSLPDWLSRLLTRFCNKSIESITDSRSALILSILDSLISISPILLESWSTHGGFDETLAVFEWIGYMSFVYLGHTRVGRVPVSGYTHISIVFWRFGIWFWSWPSDDNLLLFSLFTLHFLWVSLLALTHNDSWLSLRLKIKTLWLLKSPKLTKVISVTWKATDHLHACAQR